MVHRTMNLKMRFFLTLEFLISVGPQINVGLGKFGKNNKRRLPNKRRPWKIFQSIFHNFHKTFRETFILCLFF